MSLLLSLVSTLLQIVVIVVVADFIAGVIHWLEDAYFSAETPVLGPLVIRPNIVHHHHPRFFTHFTWWQSSWMLVVLGALTVLGACALGVLGWQVWVFVAVGVNANEIHKWSHRTAKENGPIITALQRWRILQTPAHHGLHHTDPKNTFYCPITNVVNPVLERVALWSRLESVLERLFGVTHRVDTAVRGQGPGPAWLAEYRPVTRVDPTDAAKTAPSTCDCATCPGRHGGTCTRRGRPASRVANHKVT